MSSGRPRRLRSSSTRTPGSSSDSGSGLVGLVCAGLGGGSVGVALRIKSGSVKSWVSDLPS